MGVTVKMPRANMLYGDSQSTAVCGARDLTYSLWGQFKSSKLAVILVLTVTDMLEINGRYDYLHTFQGS